MRITIDIDDEILKNAMKLTGEKKKGPAITKATSEFVRREMIKKFANMVMEGEFEDYPMTNDELEAVER
jgi:Arc/MetJ family transcription regulator